MPNSHRTTFSGCSTRLPHPSTMDSEPQRGLNSDPCVQPCPTLSLPLPTVSNLSPHGVTPTPSLGDSKLGQPEAGLRGGMSGFQFHLWATHSAHPSSLWTSVCVRVCSVVQSCPALCYPARLLCPWDFSGQNTSVSCHFLLQGISPTQGSNPHPPYLLRWQANSLSLSHLGSP